MDLDVVVVAYRSGAHLRRCVEPLCAQPGISVYVVDNACPDASSETVADLALTTVMMRRNAGFGAGCNAGARLGSAPAVLFLNPDARVEPGDALLLAERLRDDPSIGAVGPRLVDEDGRLHLSVRRFPRLRSAFGEALFLHHALPHAQWTTELVNRPAAGEAEWLSGAALCVRRAALEEIGGFDERFFLYSEDTDLCARLRHAGCRIVYDPAPTATHVGGQSAPPPLQERRKIVARLLYARLHESRLRRAGFRLAYTMHEALRLPLACFRSRDDVHGRLDALAGAVAVPLQRRA
jgi:N-acetylglucosaminyl-diphospho-decaprenol L-rhamnosyltransferase